MKYLLILFWMCLFQRTFAQTEQRKCANEMYEQMHANDAVYQQKRQVLEKAIQQKMIANQKARVDGINDALERVVRIPIVVHVIHTSSSNTQGVNGNITDAQIANQIRVLNEDYRKKTGTNGFNTNKVGADCEIEFYLATVDPNGKPTNGINRVYNAQADYSVFNDQELLSNLSYWPSNRYLNVWVTKLRSNFLGYGQLPSVAVGKIAGLDDSSAADAKVDGFFCDYRYFGTGGLVTSATYNLGRTATHEIGHWLGLFHTWGDTNCGTDYCDDTPTCQSSNSTITCNTITSRCDGVSSTNMIENYMDYSPDRCMNIFTLCQKSRMRAVLDISPRRRQLIDYWNALPEAETLTVSVEPSIVQDESAVKILLKGTQTVDVQLVDMTGRRIFQDQIANTKSIQYPLSLGSLPNGKYLLKVYTATECVTPKLIVMK